MDTKHHVLILGASYGSLLGTKFLLAGHAVTLVCTQPTAELINREGTRVRLPVRGRQTPVTISSKGIGAPLVASTPEQVDAGCFDLAVFAMQEPQYAASDVRALTERVAAARLPCLAIMNMPPLPFLKRIPALALEPLARCYTDPGVWRDFAPELVTLASPDPQAMRPPHQGKNVLDVGLPTNFKVAPFATQAHTRMLRRLQADIEASRFDAGDGPIDLPVKLKVHDSLFVPTAKWPMLLTGNYRCIGRDKTVSIREAVHADIEASRRIYEFVAKICRQLGAAEADLVPFEKYAQAAQGLRKPSSVARALLDGATQVERVDLLVQQIGRQQASSYGPLDEIVALTDDRLRANRARRRPAPNAVITGSLQPANAAMP